jgi:sugar phosphate isomerase/epimerase
MDSCLFTDALVGMSLDEALDLAAETGIDAVEVAAGGAIPTPHLDARELLRDASARQAFMRRLDDRGLTLAAVNCAAWPLHPRYGAEHVEMIRNAIQVAGELGVDTVVTMSGCPGDGPDARTVNWLGMPWTVEASGILEEQWEIAIETWSELAGYAESHGVNRIALELHPMHLAYNVPTLMRLRDAVGTVVGANVDPSHFFWQRIDALASIRALGDAVHHVHLKDVVFDERELALHGVLDSRLSFDGGSDGRAWIFRTMGTGHTVEFWAEFVAALREIGYEGALSIENEDPYLPGSEGVREAFACLAAAIDAADKSSNAV